MSKWRELAERAVTDLTAALSDTDAQALRHLQDAHIHIDQAREALEDEDSD